MKYAKIVQWVAGPVATLDGWLATQIVNHWHIFGELGIGHSQVGQAFFNGTVFAVSAAVTYAAHHKFLDKLAVVNHVLAETAGVSIPAAVMKEATAIPTASLTTGRVEATLRQQIKEAGMEPVA